MTESQARRVAAKYRAIFRQPGHGGSTAKACPTAITWHWYVRLTVLRGGVGKAETFTIYGWEDRDRYIVDGEFAY